MVTPIFIIGQPRSGSTLWQNIITQDHRIFRIGEMHFLNPWKKDFRYFYRNIIGNLYYEKNVDNMIDKMFSQKVFSGITASFWRNEMPNFSNQTLKNIIKKKIIDSNKSLESIFKILIQEISKYYGHDRCCSKFPVYVNYANKLFEWFPNCKILHVTRDPRAIAISKTNDPGGTRMLNQNFPQWRLFIRYIMMLHTVVQFIWCSQLHLKLKKNRNYRIYRYEDLLTDPEETVKSLCTFLNIEYNQKMLSPRKGQASSLTGNKIEGIDKAAAYRWKNKISFIEKTIITKATKHSMLRYGYYGLK